MKRTKDDGKEESAGDPAGPSSSNGTDAPAPAAVTSSSASAAAAAAAAASVRTTGRVKKPKQVYDPSDNYISRASNRGSIGSVGAAATATASATVGVAGNEQSPPATVLVATAEANDSLDSNPSPAASEKQPQAQQQQPSQPQHSGKVDTCQKCSKSEPKRGSGHKSNFLTCKTCMQKWHFPCLAVNFENLVLARKKYKCEKCRYCNACNIRGRNLPICSVCVEPYHPHCNNKAIKPNAKAIEIDPKWKCFRCEATSLSSQNNNNNNNNSSTINNTSSSGGEQPSPLVKKSNAGRKKRILSDPTGQKKPAKMEKLEKLEKLDKPDKMDSSLEKLDKPDKTDKLEKLEKTEKLEKLEKLEKPKSKSEKLKELSPLLKLKREAEDPDNEDNSQKRKKKLEDPEQIGEEEESPKNSASSRLSAPSSPRAGGGETDADSTVDIQKQPVASWTVEQVVGFVGKRYPNEASVFRYQDIDGASLLLLTRQDVMTRFGLKLGPALRVFELVLSLQSRSDDVAVAWVE